MSVLLHRSHPLSRLLAGCLFLFVALSTPSLWVALSLIILSMLLIRGLDGDWRNIQRLVSLLRWFVIPIFLLHAFLSPGELILPHTPLPMTWEGVSQGVWLSIRFVAIFIVAMLLFRLLYRAEWLHALLSIPWLGRGAIAYLLMLTAMRRSMGDQLGQMRQQWRLRPDWRRGALFLLAAFRAALATGREQAWVIWLRWPEEPRSIHAATASDRADIVRSLPVSAAWMLFALAVLMLSRP